MIAEIMIAFKNDLNSELSSSAPESVVITQRMIALMSSIINGIKYFSGILFMMQ